MPHPGDRSFGSRFIEHMRDAFEALAQARSMAEAGALMVSRLSAMEAVSLHTESSTVPAHAVALIIIEASDQLSHQRLRELVGSALPQLSRFRCRLVGQAAGIGSARVSRDRRL
ncbi:MAG TPA: hypothetical protein VIU87_02555 [Mycobacterium sp.]